MAWPFLRLGIGLSFMGPLYFVYFAPGTVPLIATGYYFVRRQPVPVIWQLLTGFGAIWVIAFGFAGSQG